jgi:hypothetical protein
MAVCGGMVTFMYDAYRNCTNLITAVCGPNVWSIDYAYCGCTNLKTAVCGPNVASMVNTYQNCTNLTEAVCGLNVTNMGYAYYNSTNIRGNAYFYSSNIINVRSCFENRRTNQMLNVYVQANTITANTVLNGSNSVYNSITGKQFTWTDDTTNARYYNTTYNIYVYPVENVRQTYLNHKVPDALSISYIKNEYIQLKDNLPSSEVGELDFERHAAEIDSGFLFSIDLESELFDKVCFTHAEVL